MKSGSVGVDRDEPVVRASIASRYGFNSDSGDAEEVDSMSGIDKYSIPSGVM